MLKCSRMEKGLGLCLAVGVLIGIAVESSGKKEPMKVRKRVVLRDRYVRSKPVRGGSGGAIGAYTYPAHWADDLGLQYLNEGRLYDGAYERISGFGGLRYGYGRYNNYVY